MRARWWYSTVALCVLTGSFPAWAQTQPPAGPPPSGTPTIPQDPPDEPPPAIVDPPVDPEQPPEEEDLPAQTRATGKPPAIDLSTLETENLSLLYFDPGQTYLTPYVARSFENSMAFQKKLFDWEPWDRTTVLLKDFSDYGNAAAMAAPNNAVFLDIAPLSLSFETFSAGERFFTLMNHELVHVATMDAWNSRDARWRRIFGGKPTPIQKHPESILYSYLASPRVNIPRWFGEGSGVFLETWMAGGFGRAQGAYDEMVFRSKVRDGAKFYSPVGLESEGSSIDFLIGVNDYLYGTRFFSYLALTYSPEKVVEWLKRDEDSAAYYASQFERVFDRPLNTAWNDWIAWEHQFQKANLASVEAYPATPVERLAESGLGSVSRAFLDPASNSLIGAFYYPGVIPHVGALSLDTGEIRRFADVKGPMLYSVTSLAFDPERRLAWYTADNYAYRDLMQLDVATGETRMLMKDARVGDLAFNRRDRTLWGLRHLNGYVTLVRMEAPYTRWSQVHTFDYGQILFDLDVSPDGEMLSASVGEVDGEQSVRVWRLADLAAGSTAEIAKLELGSSAPESFVFAPDGEHLFGSAYYTGVSNIYRFEIATQTFEAVSNASTGFFRPIPQADGSLIVYEFTGEGLVPGRIDPKPLESLGSIKFLGAEVAARHPVVKTWAVGSPASVPLDELITKRGKYVPLKEMELSAAYPVIEGYKEGVAAGWHAIIQDPLQFNQLTATLTYSLGGELEEDAERWHLDLEYQTPKWRFRYWHNDADFYDLFGPTKRSRKGDAYMVGYKHAFLYDPPRQLDFFADAAVYRGLDTLPGAQNVQATFENLTSFQAGLRYSDTTSSIGAIDYEKGVRWELAVSEDYANDSWFPKLRAGLDIGTPLPIRNSSVWLYSAVGAGGGTAESPLSNFYFGAFGNNVVDDRSVKRYRDYDSFPGFEINELAGREFVRSVAEWNLPPIRFSDIGTSWFFLRSARTALFAGVLGTDEGDGVRRNYQTAGVQMDWGFTLAQRLPMTLSLGAAAGFEGGEHRSQELLISLKIM